MIRTCIVMTGALLGAAGCIEPGAAGGPTSAPTELREVSVQPDFTFRTIETVAVEVDATEAVFGSAVDAPVEVRTEEGAVLFRGAVRKGAKLGVEVSAPAGTGALELTVGGEAQSVSVEGGRAAARAD